MVKRQRMQSQILLGDFGIHHATHVLPQHGIVRQHGPFGHRLCAAGVHNLRQVLAGQVNLWQGLRASGQFMEMEHACHWLAGVFRRQVNELLHLGV